MNLQLTLPLYTQLAKLYNRVNRISDDAQYERCRRWFESVCKIYGIPDDLCEGLLNMLITDRREHLIQKAKNPDKVEKVENWTDSVPLAGMLPATVPSVKPEPKPKAKSRAKRMS